MRTPESAESAESPTALAGLLRRRQLWLPTWRGVLLLLLLAAAAFATVLFGAYPFLAQEAPRPGGALVVEGWVGEGTIQLALKTFRSRPYTALYCTGLPAGNEPPMSAFGSLANYGVARLERLGFKGATAIPVANSARDRTYNCGLTLRAWLKAHGGVPPDITVVTLGSHARRSRLLYQKAFGDEAKVGVVADLPSGRNLRWWRSSGEFRDVVGEIIAYLYVCLFFQEFQP